MARPKREINWDVVEKRAEAGCNGIEIAATLRVDSDTFYRRFKEHYGKAFADYSAVLVAAGDANIKFTQYMKALAGHNNMLILLGRERLNQGKDQEKVSPYEDVLALRHENMMLRARLDKMETDLKGKR